MMSPSTRLTAGVLGVIASVIAVHGATLPPACVTAIQAQQLTMNVTMTCSAYTNPFAANVPAICKLWFKYYMKPPVAKPSRDILPIMNSNVFDSSWAASTIQYMISAGVMAQAGDSGEMMYASSNIMDQWSRLKNSSQATVDAIVTPWANNFYALAAKLVEQASDMNNGWDSYARSSAYLRAGSYYFTGQWPMPTAINSLATAPLAAEAYKKGILLSGFSSQVTYINATYIDGTIKINLPILFIAPPPGSPSGKGLTNKNKHPLIVGTTGLDYFKELMWAFYGPGASKRGYAVAFFDGPGQGQVLNKEGVPFTPNWSKVVASVLDALEAHPVASKVIDFKRVTQLGYSTGGWLAAASCKGLANRTRACVLTPALLSLDLSFTQPSSDSLYGAMTYIAQQAPGLLPNGTAPLFLDALNKVFVPLVSSCPKESPAPAMFNGWFQAGIGQGWVDPDILYLIYAFTGARNGSVPGQLASAWQAYRVVLGFNATLTANSNVPTLVLNGSEDYVMGSQSQAYFNSLAPTAKKLSKLVQFDSASGAALHCQVGGVLAAEAAIYAWLNPVMGM